MAGKHHVIVGAGTAGINAIRTLRQLGDTGEITLVSAEPPYSRMVLPYMLDLSISEGHTVTASPNALEKWGVRPLFGRRVVKLNTGKNALTLDNDDTLEYDDLLIATGSSAARPPVKGADDPELYNFWTMDDARGVHGRISETGHTVVVGAGFIAFTILNALIQRSKKLTIVESAPRILPRMVDAAGAKVVAEWLSARGVTLLAGANVAKIERKGKSHVLSFKKGKPVKADLVVMATGIRTNLEWLKGSGVKVNQGILVDEHLRSNVANVYAAGDVAEGRNVVTGAAEVHAIEPTAMEHGRVAGANMAGRNVAYPGSLLMNIVGVAGLDIASFGNWDDKGAEVITGHAPQRSAYRKYLFHGDRLTGAIMIGPNRETWSENELGMMKGLIQAGTPLGEWKAFLKKHPFVIKKPFLASHTVSGLLPKTVLGQPTPAPWS